jgi:hypothetical protein
VIWPRVSLPSHDGIGGFRCATCPVPTRPHRVECNATRATTPRIRLHSSAGPTAQLNSLIRDGGSTVATKADVVSALARSSATSLHIGLVRRCGPAG